MRFASDTSPASGLTSPSIPRSACTDLATSCALFTPDTARVLTPHATLWRSAISPCWLGMMLCTAV